MSSARVQRQFQRRSPIKHILLPRYRIKETPLSPMTKSKMRQKRNVCSPHHELQISSILPSLGPIFTQEEVQTLQASVNHDDSKTQLTKNMSRLKYLQTYQISNEKIPLDMNLRHSSLFQLIHRNTNSNSSSNELDHKLTRNESLISNVSDEENNNESDLLFDRNKTTELSFFDMPSPPITKKDLQESILDYCSLQRAEKQSDPIIYHGVITDEPCVTNLPTKGRKKLLDIIQMTDKKEVLKLPLCEIKPTESLRSNQEFLAIQSQRSKL